MTESVLSGTVLATGIADIAGALLVPARYGTEVAAVVPSGVETYDLVSCWLEEMGL